jgi:AraC-like DNA-binding protein
MVVSMQDGSSAAGGVESRSADSFSAWRSLMSDRFVPLRLSRDGSGGFRGALRSVRVDGGCFSDISADAHTVQRHQRDIGRGQTTHLKLTLQFDGEGRLTQDGRTAALRPGDFAIYDTGRPYLLEFPERMHSFVMMFPHRRVGLPPSMIHGLTATVLGVESGIGPLVRTVFAYLAEHLADVDAPSGRRVVQSAMDLITASLSAELERMAPRARRRGELAVLSGYIDDHLADPTLSASTVAAAHYMSLRSLQQIFQAAATTVTGYIRSRRIERCCTDLADPMRAGASILDIAVSWGFSDAAHFSRVFRREVGCPPSEFRARALPSAVA